MTFATAAGIEDRRGGRARLQDIDPGTRILLFVLCVLTLARLIALFLSPSELGFDEAQYWAWSKNFAFGYFTKPPLIAWIIGVETEICGSGAACVRSASPIFHCATALVLAGLARKLYGRATGFWTGIFYAILPGIAVSSFLITTDVFLLFFWSVALACLVFYLEKPSLLSALGFAVATGIGLYAKYAMIYLPILVIITAIAIPNVRRAVLRVEALIALILILLLIAPNLWWNATNGFATFEHTGDNIGWSIAKLNVSRGLEFLGAQFGIAGPVVFGAMINALLLGARTQSPQTDRLLMWISWPILFAITVQGFLSQANVNWGATAYPAGVILATALVVRHRWRFFFVTNLLVCGAIAAAILIGTVTLDPRIASGPARQLRQLGGWSQTAANLMAVANRADATKIVIEGRALTAGLMHALRDDPVDVFAYLPPQTNASDQFQLDEPWTPGDPTERTMLVGIDGPTAASVGAHQIAIIDAPIYSSKSGKMAVYGFDHGQGADAAPVPTAN